MSHAIIPPPPATPRSVPPELKRILSGVAQSVLGAAILAGVALAWSVSERVTNLETRVHAQQASDTHERARAEKERERLRRELATTVRELAALNAKLERLLGQLETGGR